MTDAEDPSTIVASAIQAARDSNPEALHEALRAIDAGGWGSVQGQVADGFVEALADVLGDRPSVSDIVNLSQALIPHVAPLMNVTPYDLEFLVRGYAGAPVLAEAIPRNVAMSIAVAVIGVLPNVAGFTSGLPAYDSPE